MATTLIAQLPEVGVRARRRVALRILPFVFLLYVVNYVDRVNVAFANLRMSADLGFSDRVFGLGVGVFYVTYILFEIPGAILCERWSARKWIARIMISWGIVTILTGFVRTAGQFYAARFFLGLAESSFFPGMVVYLTHWFRVGDRGRAIACLYIAVPSAGLVGSPVAGWLLGVHWHWLAGWRWLFILEGIPAIVLGIATIFCLTDWPGQARWLPDDEREWLTYQLQTELEAKKKARDSSIFEAFRDPSVLRLTVAWFLTLTATLASFYWLPTFVKRLSGLGDRSVTSLLIAPALMGVVGMLVNGWHSDKTGERRWHVTIPILMSGVMFVLLVLVQHNVALTVLFLLLGNGIFYAFYPVFWAIPTMMLSESAAAAAFALINSIGQCGGFAGPYIIGLLNDRTHALTASFVFIGVMYLAAGIVTTRLVVRSPMQGTET